MCVARLTCLATNNSESANVSSHSLQFVGVTVVVGKQTNCIISGNKQGEHINS